MPLLPKEFRDNLVDIANDLQYDDYRRTLRRNLKPELDQSEKEEIIIACERIISFLNGKEKEEFIKGYVERERIKRIFRRQSKDGTLNSKDSITYTGLPESTFYRKIKDYDPVKDEDGKSRYKIDDLDKIARLLTDSSNSGDSFNSALCIETNYRFDRARMGFFPFSAGKFYKIVGEDEWYKYIFNDQWNVTLRIGKNSFSNYFQVKEDLESLLSHFND
ncbi:hypothetical protein AQPE_2723 [Aquipluma nitroreducens]|uniref:Uncharacterized protein n=1 Tax=Aquipluma nitroreducens TaxID=2010828 RepID=A0A5K7SAH1_9BACT|nr:hypothetical protein [Aquipluma nitroreducens]BBE18560.1 hypothetical protein AQPE_2723 [Aquipluma nitroreducens]